MARRKKVKKLNVVLGIFVIIALIAISVGIYVLVNNPNIFTASTPSTQNTIQNEVEEEPVPEDTVINIVGI